MRSFDKHGLSTFSKLDIVVNGIVTEGRVEKEEEYEVSVFSRCLKASGEEIRGNRPILDNGSIVLNQWFSNINTTCGSL